jgi:solute carrier family 25 carnitine/acylcarnitine transporter 20/29
MVENKNVTAIAVDLLAGTSGGVAQILVGHPFDTVKVNMQHSTGQAGPLATFQHVAQTSGLRGFYAGIGPPLYTVAAFNAMLFSVTGSFHRLVRPNGGNPTPIEAALVGAAAGPAVSLLATPTELLKCRLQAQGGARAPLNVTYTLEDARAGKIIYIGPFDALMKIVRFEGGLQALFKGFMPTVAREVLGNATYFGTYLYLKQKLKGLYGVSKDSELSLLSLMLAGGVAGAAFWLPVIPVDNIKTRIQLDNPHNPSYRGMIDCAQKIASTQGIKGLFRGWQPCLIRSVPANAALFTTYEITFTYLQKNFPS